MSVQTHFGNPLVEQRALAEGIAVVELAKSVIAVSGSERLTWLHSMLTADFANLKPGVSREALWLDVNGRVLNEFHAVDDGTSTFLIVDAAAVDGLLSQLDRMIFRADVSVRSCADEYVVFGVCARLDASVPGELVWVDPWPATVPGGVRYAKELPPRWVYEEHAVPVAAAAGFAAGFSLAGTDALEALRIAAHRPSIADVDERTLPHELDWLSTAVHMSKGCYRGQEAVAKTHNLGHPPRRVVFLHVDGSGHLTPRAGDEVLLGDVVVGSVTSAAVHYEAGPIALALVKRNTDVAAELVIRDAEGRTWSAAQEVLVPQDAGQAVGSPKRNLLMGGKHS